jgi:hypothetical protein
MLLLKLGPFMGLVLVESESGPPTSMGESDRDGVGLVVEFCSLRWRSEAFKSMKLLRERS